MSFFSGEQAWRVTFSVYKIFKKKYFKKNVSSQFLKNILSIFLKQDLKFGYAFVL